MYLEDTTDAGILRTIRESRAVLLAEALLADPVPDSPVLYFERVNPGGRMIWFYGATGARQGVLVFFQLSQALKRVSVKAAVPVGVDDFMHRLRNWAAKLPPVVELNGEEWVLDDDMNYHNCLGASVPPVEIVACISRVPE